MCGIAGFLNFGGQPAQPELAEAMGARLAHRGPDGAGFGGANKGGALGMPDAVATGPAIASEAVRRLDAIAASEFSKQLFQRRVSELVACA